MHRFIHIRTGKVIETNEPRRYQNKRYRRMDSPKVPDGSVAAVLAWVGDDPERRQAALGAELVGKNRISLLRALSD